MASETNSYFDWLWITTAYLKKKKEQLSILGVSLQNLHFYLECFNTNSVFSKFSKQLHTFTWAWSILPSARPCTSISQYQYRLGDEWIKSSPVEKDFGLLVDEKWDVSRKCPLTAQEANHILGCIKKCGQIKGGDSTALHCSWETPARVLCPHLGPLALRRTF